MSNKDKSVCLNTGEYVKYYAQIPDYLMESSNGGKLHDELVDFCMNHGVNGETYDTRTMHSVQYYSPIPEESPAAAGTMRVTNVVECFESTHNGRSYHFVFGDPIMYNFYNIDTKEKCESVLLATNSYCVFSKSFFEKYDFEVVDLI